MSRVQNSEIGNGKNKMNMETLKSKIPALSIAAVAALAIFLAIAWLRHDAHLRSEGALKEIQKQSAAEISGLRAKADAAVRDANQTNARALSELGASRRLLELQSRDLRQTLATLEGAERVRVQQVAALPIQEVAKRLEKQLGQGTIASPGPMEPLSHLAIEPLKEKGSSNDSITKSPHDSILADRTISLTEIGARKVETALVQLDSCRQQSSVQSEQLSACQKEGAAEAAMVEQQKSSLARLNQALGDKDQILARRETEFKAELKAARGTWLARLGRVAEFVAAGVVIGKVL